MSNRKPHIIMGERVKGNANSGYTVKVNFYDSTNTGYYTPDGKMMLDELASELDRVQRVIDARTKKLATKIADNTIE